jgi:hypothetical protein
MPTVSSAPAMAANRGYRDNAQGRLAEANAELSQEGQAGTMVPPPLLLRVGFAMSPTICPDSPG